MMYITARCDTAGGHRSKDCERFTHFGTGDSLNLSISEAVKHFRTIGGWEFQVLPGKILWYCKGCAELRMKINEARVKRERMEKAREECSPIPRKNILSRP